MTKNIIFVVKDVRVFSKENQKNITIVNIF
jgi:hypothetical protein